MFKALLLADCEVRRHCCMLKVTRSTGREENNRKRNQRGWGEKCLS